MFKKNIFINKGNKNVKTVALVIVFIITINLILGIVNIDYTYAAQERLDVSNKLNNYPGYTNLINKLKTAHPNWKFKILYTGLDWNQVIKNETTAWHGRNLIDSGKKIINLLMIFSKDFWKNKKEKLMNIFMKEN